MILNYWCTIVINDFQEKTLKPAESFEPPFDYDPTLMMNPHEDLSLVANEKSD